MLNSYGVQKYLVEDVLPDLKGVVTAETGAEPASVGIAFRKLRQQGKIRRVGHFGSTWEKGSDPKVDTVDKHQAHFYAVRAKDFDIVSFKVHHWDVRSPAVSEAIQKAIGNKDYAIGQVIKRAQQAMAKNGVGGWGRIRFTARVKSLMGKSDVQFTVRFRSEGDPDVKGAIAKRVKLPERKR
jgi:hypothetical protein